MGKVLERVRVAGLALIVLGVTGCPHLRYIGYWANNILSNDSAQSAAAMSILRADGNVVTLASTDESFAAYAPYAQSDPPWLFIIAQVTNTQTCSFTPSEEDTVRSHYERIRQFLNGTCTGGVAMWSRVAGIQLADEPTQGTGDNSSSAKLQGEE